MVSGAQVGEHLFAAAKTIELRDEQAGISLLKRLRKSTLLSMAEINIR